MKIANVRKDDRHRAAFVVGDELVDVATAAAHAGWDSAEAERAASTRWLVGLPLEALHDLQRSAIDALGTLRGVGAVNGIDRTRLAPPIETPEKIVCIGLNYLDHAAEVGAAPPAAPMFFAKFANSLVGPTDDIVPPADTSQVDYEAEVAVVIGRRGRYIAKEEALGHVAALMAFNDVSARDLQLANNLWTGGKAVDTFGPCGPWLVTVDEFEDLRNIGLRTRVNGVTVQDGTTANLIFDIADIVSFLSRIMTLEPGDVIATGTPAGVRNAHGPGTYLRPGDLVEVEVDGVGVLRNRVV